MTLGEKGDNYGCGSCKARVHSSSECGTRTFTETERNSHGRFAYKRLRHLAFEAILDFEKVERSTGLAYYI